jgi:hypothetical protein
VLGRILKGIKPAPAARQLEGMGISPTLGQTIGGAAKQFEEALTSVPGVGDMIRNRQRDALSQMNERILADAGSGFGITPTKLGLGGIDEIKAGVSPTYDAATAGARVPIDPTYTDEVTQVGQRISGLPDDLAAKVKLAIQNRLVPAINNGEMTGEAYQQAQRGLKGYRAEATKPGFEQDYRDVLGGLVDANRGLMTRGGAPEVVSRLDAADAAYRKLKVAEDAALTAKNQEDGLFTPAQANNAATRASRKYPGPKPFANVIDPALEVLPNRLPDSGTAKRLMAAQGGALLTGGTIGAGVGALGSDNPMQDASAGSATGGLGAVALTSLLMALNSRSGQKALKKVLTQRGRIPRSIGGAIGQKAGIFGSASVPLLLESNN